VPVGSERCCSPPCERFVGTELLHQITEACCYCWTGPCKHLRICGGDWNNFEKAISGRLVSSLAVFADHQVLWPSSCFRWLVCAWRNVSAWADCLCSPRPGWPASVGLVAAWENLKSRVWYTSCLLIFRKPPQQGLQLWWTRRKRKSSVDTRVK